MKILITGASGFIGSTLTQYLSSLGHQIYPMLRGDFSKKSPSSSFYWQPEKNLIHYDTKIKIDVVINLSGAGIADKRWSKKRKQEIINSRVVSTKLLTETLINLSHKPKLFISGSAIGFYGDTNSTIADETSATGSGFMTEICQQWEAASQAVQQSGIRLVNIRTGVVLSTKHGMLANLLLPAKLGLAGKVGSGQQFISWISRQDICHSINFIINTPELYGPINLVSPQAVTNSEFIKALGDILHRPTIFPLPAFLARLIFGELADALLLSNSHIIPNKLIAAGYLFKHPKLEQALHYSIRNNN